MGPGCWFISGLLHRNPTVGRCYTHIHERHSEDALDSDFAFTAITVLDKESTDCAKASYASNPDPDQVSAPNVFIYTDCEKRCKATGTNDTHQTGNDLGIAVDGSEKLG
jgi:hypothetical protein